jgi:hypothetical protein
VAEKPAVISLAEGGTITMSMRSRHAAALLGLATCATLSGAPAYAQSQLSLLIDACARGNMYACSQANAQSAYQRQLREQSQQPPSAYDIERRYNWQNNMNQGYSYQGGVYNDVYKHQLYRGY